MPIKRCKSNGKLGFKFGDTGKCFTYTTGDKSSRERARRQAEAQGRAIKANKKGQRK